MRPRMVLVLASLLAFACAFAAALPGTASAAFATRTLAEGSTGKDVAKAQRLLSRALGEPVDADGEFGPMTAAAVRRFEVAGALTVDGSLTPDEQLALKAAAKRARAEQRAAEAVAATGGANPAAPAPTPAPAPTGTATLNPDGTATPPTGAPRAVAAIIAAGNEIATKPYRFGGGHRTWVDTGYDCSGSVSYALHGAGLLDASMPSGGFEEWGEP
ncbi:MAG TPA: peptidoglycan-binding protein, partial [Capillimicrobium sp.]|nr:peptidoglycan-binding protein [Capillimicrobium sp.]